MTDGRWSGDQWGDIEWAGGGSVSHSLSARAGIVAGAWADRIGVRHILEGSATVSSDAFGIGAGPGAIHPLRVTGVVASVAVANSLRKSHSLDGSAQIASAAGATMLRKRHRMGALGSITTTASGVLSIGHPLKAGAKVASTASASGLVMGHWLRAGAVVASEAHAVYTIEIPEILEPSQIDPTNPENVAPGSINLVANPIAAQGLASWGVAADALVTIDPTFRWDGTRSIRVQPVSPGSGVVAQTVRPMGLATLPGSIVWGQMMLALNLLLPLPELPPPPDPEDPTPPPEPEPYEIDPYWVTGWVEVTYSDGSIDAGEETEPFAVVGTGFDGDWDIFIASCMPDADKVVVAARVLVVSATTLPSVPDAFWVGGAQIEYDRWMLGPQPVHSTSQLAQSQGAS